MYKKSRCQAAFCLSLWKRFFEYGREVGLKLEVFPSDWVMETQFVGMQAQTAERVVAIAVFRVAYDRMPEVLHVDADLVLASGFEPELHQ